MSPKILSSLSDDNRGFRKQVGCISIYKLFYRNNFPAGWRGGQQHKRLPAPGEDLDQVDTNDARRKAGMQNDSEVHREKARASTGSSRASYSSSPYSSTFSSAENPTPRQSETPSQRKKNTNVECQSQKATTRHKHQHSSTKGLQSPDIRDVVKDSMHREARSLPIRFQATDDCKVTLMKYVDSPRPLQQSKLRKPETATFYEGSAPERIKISKHRSSFDERETRETMKLRELPRLSLDSRASALRNSPRMDMEVAGNHAGSSSIIMKLMGLDAFPDTIPTPGNRTATTKVGRNFLSEVTQGKTQNKASVFQTVSQGSPRVAAQSRKPLSNAPHQSSSVYGEIEKRAMELELRRSAKDLRALKQILGVENQNLKSSEFILRRKSLDKNPNLSICENKKAYQKDPALKGSRAQKPLVSSFGMKKPNLKEKVIKVSSTKVHSVDTIQELMYKSEHPAFRERPKDVISGWHLSSMEKKATWRNLEAEQIRIVPELKLDHCTTSRRGMEMASPRLQTNALRTRGEFPPTTPSLDTGRARTHSSKKVAEESSRSRRVGRFKSFDLPLSDDQLSELSNDTRGSSYKGDADPVKSGGNKTVASQMEREVISCLANSIYTNPRKQNSVTTSEESMQSLERETNELEQPSPISVLDNTFYTEGSPSPVAKIPTAFREDERPSPEEEWHHESLRHIKGFTVSLPKYEYNPKSENLEHIPCGRRLLGIEPSEDANGSVSMRHNQHHRCIRETLQESGDTIINRKSDDLLSSWHPTNSKKFNTHEEMEGHTQAEKAELVENIHKKYSNQNIQRKLVLEMANDILIRKVTRGGLFTTVKKKTSVGLMKEVCSEIDHLCSMQYYNLDDDDDDDGLTRLLTADMKYESDDWTDHDSEAPCLVLEIERQIFKDLINEVVAGEDVGLHDCPKRTRRKLFN